MKVFKFGGASVKDAESVRNVARIVKEYSSEPLVVVVSAMGKSTNAMEAVHRAVFAKDHEAVTKALDVVKDFHFKIIEELFEDSALVHSVIDNIFKELEQFVGGFIQPKSDYIYDQVVSIGELISTQIISHYLNACDLENLWFDARKLIKTDYNYREGHVDWNRTQTQVNETIGSYLMEGHGRIAITQGFIGGADNLNTTTLGREGSDYSAAILAWCLPTTDVTIWKDVPGVLNADPRYFEETSKRPQISYKEAIELAYYGASVIHPKTIQPLQDKKIKLFVKSFINPLDSGTLISEDQSKDGDQPALILKPNQRLISIATRDFAFIVEENIRDIFEHFSQHKVKVNLVQNSAINFSVSVDDHPEHLQSLISELQQHYKVLYNDDLDLLTIRHYTPEIIEQFTSLRTVLVEQKTRLTYRALLA